MINKVWVIQTSFLKTGDSKKDFNGEFVKTSSLEGVAGESTLYFEVQLLLGVIKEFLITGLGAKV